MNRNDYRRALVMLRSLKNGVSGYLRLERRTLMGTLQFTINGAPADGELYAILLYRKNGAWNGVRLSAFGPARYGQVGLVWKFDPRSIEGRTLEQYDLAAVIEIRSGVCELILCGNLNGSVEADWTQIREAACRLFSPVRISGAPIAPIDETLPDAVSPGIEESGLQTLPELGEALPLPDSAGDVPSAPSEDLSTDSLDCRCESASDPETPDTIPYGTQDSEPDELDTPAVDTESDDLLDIPAAEEIEPDETDVPADYSYDVQAQPVHQDSDPALETISDQPVPDKPPVAGDQLELDDPQKAWPEAIEPLRSLFFSSEAVIPFEGAEGYIFIRAPLPAECGMDSCMIGLRCENGFPARVCYALPSAYSHEPPVGLEGYVWRGDHTNGYWIICENVSGCSNGEAD